MKNYRYLKKLKILAKKNLSLNLPNKRKSETKKIFDSNLLLKGKMKAKKNLFLKLLRNQK